jgi:hypothetical protein
MFPSRTPFLFVLIVVGIVGAVIATLCITGNPLSILGLFFLPEPPLMQDPEQVARIGQIERELEDADGGSGTPMGFV